jgi:hypothetical protein
LSYEGGALRPLVEYLQTAVESREVSDLIGFLSDSDALQALALQTKAMMDESIRYIKEQQREEQRRALTSAAYAKAERETPEVKIKDIQREIGEAVYDGGDDPREGKGRKTAKQVISGRLLKEARAKREGDIRTSSRKYQRMAKVAERRGLLSSGGDEPVFGGGKRRTMKNKSKSKRNPKNQTHRKRKGKVVGKRTATAHRPKTARNAKKITKKKKSNTKTQRSAKPAKKRAINRRARNARKERK